MDNYILDEIQYHTLPVDGNYEWNKCRSISFSRIVIGAFLDSDLLGFISVAIDSPVNGMLTIENCFVYDEYMGCGVNTGLLEYIRAVAIQAKSKGIFFRCTDEELSEELLEYLKSQDMSLIDSDSRYYVYQAADLKKNKASMLAMESGKDKREILVEITEDKHIICRWNKAYIKAVASDDFSCLYVNDIASLKIGQETIFVLLIGSMMHTAVERTKSRIVMVSDCMLSANEKGILKKIMPKPIETRNICDFIDVL